MMNPYHTWHSYPPIQTISPVLAMAAGNGKLWAGSVGGLACYEQTWELQNTALPLSSITALCYADGWLIAGGPEGIARSPDGGATWQLATISGTIYPIAVILPSPDFGSDHTFLAGTIGGGVMRSENAGNTWKPTSFGLQNFEVQSLTWSSTNILLAATSDGIYRSPNGGRAWRAVSGIEGVSVSTITFIPGGSALAGCENGDFLRSTNEGISWFDLSDNLPEGAQPLLLAAPGQDNLILSTLQHGSFHSRDGQTWQPIDPEGFQAWCLLGNLLYVGMPDGIALFEDNRFVRQAGPPLHDLRYLLVAQNKPYIAGLHSGTWSWEIDKGWLAMPDVPGLITCLTATPDGVLVLSGSDGLMRSVDGGYTWTNILAGKEGLVAYITFRDNGYGWAVRADGSQLFISSDNGSSWKPANTPFGVLPVVALQATSDIVIAATYHIATQIAQLWYSVDDGLTWKRGVEVKTNWPVVATCPNPPVITLGGSMFILQPDGSGKQRKVGPAGCGVRRMVSDGRILLALTTFGLLRSEDMGQTWQPEPECPPLDEILDVTLDNGTLYILLPEARLWTRSV